MEESNLNASSQTPELPSPTVKQGFFGWMCQNAPRTGLVVWPVLSALWLVSGGFPGWRLLLVFALWSVLMYLGGCCLNASAGQHAYINVKSLAASGRMTPVQGWVWGLLFLLIGLALILLTNWATLVGAALAVVLLCLSLWVRRGFYAPQMMMGIVLGLGIPMAFTAVQGGPWHGMLTNPHISLAWLLFTGNALWALAYGTEDALTNRNDDLKAGVRTPATVLGRYDRFVIILSYMAFLFIWSTAGFRLGARWPYWIGLLIALIQAIWHYTLIEERERAGCLKAFRLTPWIGFGIFLSLVAADLLY